VVVGLGAARGVSSSVVLGQLLPVLILPLFLPPSSGWTTPGCSTASRRLAAGTGAGRRRVYPRPERRDKKAHAALAGLADPRVLLGDTLLVSLRLRDRLVFAHELLHHVTLHLPHLIASRSR